ncbi:MAG TPA: hypothetical protein VM925_05405 [Labilithrix sp.]|nr:hypothetical protein [Labilithrix sp.]
MPSQTHIRVVKGPLTDDALVPICKLYGRQDRRYAGLEFSRRVFNENVGGFSYHACAYDGEVLVGHYAVVPVPIVLHRERRLSGKGEALFVDDAYRKHTVDFDGVQTRISQAMIAAAHRASVEEFDLVHVFTHEKADRIFMAAGMKKRPLQIRTTMLRIAPAASSTGSFRNALSATGAARSRPTRGRLRARSPRPGLRQHPSSRMRCRPPWTRTPSLRACCASMPSCRAGSALGLGPVPILFGTPESSPRDSGGQGMHCALDVFGSVFFMLTRYEEVVLQATDAHGRFPATASLLHQAGLLDRPLANEYVEILRECMLTLWPGLPRKPRSFRIRHHHDVDQPFLFPFKPRRTWARAAIGDVVKRRDPRTALARTTYCASMNLGVHRTERFPTFERLMDVDERAGARGVYFFIPRSVHALDGSYDLEHPAIERLLQRIASRGHVVESRESELYDTLVEAAPS